MKFIIEDSMVADLIGDWVDNHLHFFLVISDTFQDSFGLFGKDECYAQVTEPIQDLSENEFALNLDFIRDSDPELVNQVLRSLTANINVFREITIDGVRFPIYRYKKKLMEEYTG